MVKMLHLAWSLRCGAGHAQATLDGRKKVTVHHRQIFFTGEAPHEPFRSEALESYLKVPSSGSRPLVCYNASFKSGGPSGQAAKGQTPDQDLKEGPRSLQDLCTLQGTAHDPLALSLRALESLADSSRLSALSPLRAFPSPPSLSARRAFRSPHRLADPSRHTICVAGSTSSS